MDINAIRKDFPILSRTINNHPLVYLDNAATSQKPQVVIDAITNYYSHHNANVHRGIHTLGDESTQAYQNARVTISRFIGASEPNELIFIRNTTEAVNLVAYSWGLSHLRQGDEIIVTELEHHSNLIPWQRVCEQTGAKLIFLPITANGDLATEYLESLVGKRTKLVALTHISNVLGTVNDVYHLTKTIKGYQSKVKIFLDAAQSVPHMPIHVSQLNVDFMAFSGHKMLGPMGIGGLWIKKDLLLELDPFLVGGGMIKEVIKSKSTWADLPDRFDAGTPNVAGAVGLAAACEYLKQVDLLAIHEHEHLLTTYSLNRLIELEGEGKVNVYGPRDLENRAGILTFNIVGAHAHDVAQILDREFGIAIRSGHHCNQILNDALGVPATCRASVYLYNTQEEIDLLITGIEHIHSIFNK
jgi:cysteine desulfurase/selenocysteine lyase